MIDVSSSIFKVAFTNFAFLLFLIRIVPRSLLSRSLRFDSHIQMCGIRNFTHDERELNFIHTAHTGMTRHLLDLRMTHDSCRVDCITTNLFSTSTSNLNYNSADAKKIRPFHSVFAVWLHSRTICVYLKREREMKNTAKWSLFWCNKSHLHERWSKTVEQLPFKWRMQTTTLYDL